MIKGYFKGKYVNCICTSPQGQPQWYTGGKKVPGTTTDLWVRFDHSKPERNFTCKSSSASDAGSKLVVRFAFFDRKAVTIQSSSSTIDLCPHNGKYTHIRHTTTCSVSKAKINPAPAFHFIVNGKISPGKLQNDSSVYKAEFILSPTNSVGVRKITCLLHNTITDKKKIKQTIITIRSELME
ncbi:hypothetical protein PoB_005384100 [Plakobranchus ocellatus]|uniref:Uncharacterized protein n=1 Tax=Plakobranchus ocellatus TaxID=259542 RepID=A0AAV4C3K6_9GAST|nr:hypothetical protein PoB_005384100 [Plakobranchus ocellatus]